MKINKAFFLPDLGEGLAEATIREWYVAVGDEVAVDQPIVAMETDKALVDIPSPFSGVITKCIGDVNETLATGSLLVEFEIEGSLADKATVVGTVHSEAQQLNIAEDIIEHDILSRCTADAWQYLQQHQISVQQLEEKCHHLTMITYADVCHLFPQESIENNVTKDANSLSPLRRSMFRNISKAHHQVADVTVFDKANISHWPKGTDFTVAVIKAIAAAIKHVPIINSHFHDNSQQLITLDQFNCGLAMDTDHGLFVPVIKDVNALSDTELRALINQFKADTQNYQLKQEHTQSPSLLLSNFGMHGAKYATPMVMPPMVCIVGIGQSHQDAIIVEQEVTVGTVLPISVTVDHRVITGGEVTRFLSYLVKALEQQKT